MARESSARAKNHQDPRSFKVVGCYPDDRRYTVAIRLCTFLYGTLFFLLTLRLRRTDRILRIVPGRSHSDLGRWSGWISGLSPTGRLNLKDPVTRAWAFRKWWPGPLRSGLQVNPTI